ncbi:MAG: 50S ribosomal protein L6 [Terriglobia bacterium]
MSRIGRKAIPLPAGVTVKITEGAVEVQGPKGKLVTPVPPGIGFRQQENTLRAQPKAVPEGPISKEVLDRLERRDKANWGLARALAANAVQGVTQGFSKQLEIVGVGYKAEAQGRKIVFSLGYSKPVEFPLPEGIEVKVERNRLTVSGIDKHQVGEVTAKIRALRPPDPYKQKGVRRVGEHLRKKAGKAAATVAVK